MRFMPRSHLPLLTPLCMLRYTTRGKGIVSTTFERRNLLAAVHELASRREIPEDESDHYISAEITRLEKGELDHIMWIILWWIALG
eukprot:1897427-Amphidinium_carterae.1